MKLVSFLQAGEERLGLLHGDAVVDPLLASGEQASFGSALAFIRSGERAIAAGRAILAGPPKQALLAAKDVVLTAPLRPSTILCSGSNYRDHNAEKANTPISGKEPEFFVKTADCVVGPDEPIVFDPLLSKKLDCEVELAIVIGKAGRHIPIERALEHVFGYTIVNDVTARDWCRRRAIACRATWSNARSRKSAYCATRSPRRTRPAVLNGSPLNNMTGQSIRSG